MLTEYSHPGQVSGIQIVSVFAGGVKRNLFPNNEREEPQDGRRYNSWHNLVTKFILKQPGAKFTKLMQIFKFLLNLIVLD